MTFEEYKIETVDKAKTISGYRSNHILNNKDTEIFDIFFDEAVSVIKKWRTIKDEEKFIEKAIENNYWQMSIVNFIIGTLQINGHINVKTFSSGGQNVSINESPQARLRNEVGFSMGE